MDSRNETHKSDWRRWHKDTPEARERRNRNNKLRIARLSPEKQQQLREEKTKRNRGIAERYKLACLDYKGGCCSRCGLTDTCTDVFDFHHVNPSTKKFDIASKCRELPLSDETKAELDKCLLVCSNCHRRIHAELREKEEGCQLLSSSESSRAVVSADFSREGLSSQIVERDNT